MLGLIEQEVMGLVARILGGQHASDKAGAGWPRPSSCAGRLLPLFGNGKAGKVRGDAQQAKGAMMTVPFMPMFPCFSILADDCRGPVTAETGAGKGLVVLTDEDLLRRFREEHGVAGPTIRFEFGGQLALYLDALPGDVTHVAFDPGKRTTTVSAAELYRKLLEGLQ